MNANRWALFGILAILLIAACRTSIPEVTSSPMLDLAKTAMAKTEAAQNAQATLDAAATAEFLQTADVHATLDEQATAEAEGTAAVLADATSTKEALNVRSTSNAEGTQTANTTATAIFVSLATAQAESIVGIVNDLYDEGVLSSKEGEYVRLMDFNESWAQLGWYIFYPTGFRKKNFILRTDASWRSASDKADWWNSGCGFVFRENEEIDHYLTYLGLDGNAYLVRMKGNIPSLLGQGYYGSVSTPAGEAELMLIVENENIRFFVNGKRVIFRQDRAHDNGNLHLTLVSGTNKDYGTQCEMKDTDLWILDE